MAGQSREEEKRLADNNVVEETKLVETEAIEEIETEAEPAVKKTMEQRKAEEDKLVSDIIVAQAELDALKKEHGLEEKEKGVKKVISNFFDKKENREKVLVNKKKYLIVSILLGWMGAHRFYTKQYGLGLFYLATCWTGFPVSLVVIDVLIAIPIKPDENGNILL